MAIKNDPIAVTTATDYNNVVGAQINGADIVTIEPIDQSELAKFAAAGRQAVAIAKIQNDTANIDINTAYINQLANQLEYATNCDVLMRIIQTHLKKLEDKALAVLDHEIKLIEDYFGIAHLPSPNPISIVKWLGKLILGPIFPQIMAEIQYVISMVKLAIAIEHLAEAIAKVGPKLEKCAIQVVHQLEQEVKNLEQQAYDATVGQVTNAVNNAVRDINTAVNDISSAAIKNVDSALGPDNPISKQINAISSSVTVTTSSAATDVVNGIRTSVNGAIGPALKRVDQMQSVIQVVTGPSANIPMYDTTSANNFLNSHYAIGNTFSGAISNYVTNTVITGPAFSGSVTLGSNLIKNVPGDTVITIGDTLIAADNSIPANTTAVAISNTAGGFSATTGGTVGSSILTLAVPDPSVVIGLALTSVDPAFANGCTVTNIYGSMVTISAPYLGTAFTSIVCNYVIEQIQMSNAATATNANASITFNQMPVKLAGK